ncbi:MAG: hypothetical protein WCE79_03685 [Xanthobacteraceae bacterium]
MDVSSLAAAMVSAQLGRLQLAAAAKMLKMNADNAASIVQVIDAAQKNAAQFANAAAGLGQNLDITV